MAVYAKLRRWLAVFLIGAATLHAHDALQSSTNLWLRPDQLEVEIILSRVPARALVDGAPPVPVTTENFGSTYRALFKKSATQMLHITVEGRPLPLQSADVALYEETDIQFTLIYPRPPNGRLRVTADFVKRMEDGYINTLSLNQDGKVIGAGDQRAEKPDWDFNLGPSAAITPPQPAATEQHDSYFIIPHFNLPLLGAILAVIILLAIGCFRQKSRD